MGLGLLLRRILGLELRIPPNPILGLGSSGLGTSDDPLVFPPQQGLTLSLCRLGLVVALLPQLQIPGIVGLVEINTSPLHLGNAVADPLQEVSVVGHH